MKSAIILIAFALLFSSCSRKSEQEYYQEADAAYNHQDFQGAITLFRQVIDRAPNSAYAESSQYRIALAYNNDLHDTRQSLREYEKFRELFPASKESPTALFLIGFLFNNELHHIDSAKACYEEFLRLYPHHELATSAKFELESLGKDPLHVLQSRVEPEEKPVTPPVKKSKSK